MKSLFSPWRTAYIQSFNKKKKSQGCLFCRISKEKKDAENLIVWRGETCFAVLNRYPYNSGHLMVVPYRHNRLFSKLTSEENSEIMGTMATCIKALDGISKPHGYNFGANLGRVAGAGIDKHIHFHLVPRWNGDTNFMPVLSDIKVVSERLDEMCVTLSGILKSKKAK
jgi:ATP adenylyltransferase